MKFFSYICKSVALDTGMCDALPLDTIRASLQNRYSSRFDFGCSGSLSRQKFCSIKSLLYFCIVNEAPK